MSFYVSCASVPSQESLLRELEPQFRSSLYHWPPGTLTKLTSLAFNFFICKVKKMPTLQNCDGN